MAETKTTLFNKFLQIQKLQEELDTKKKDYRKLGSEVKSLGQRVPTLIRELDLG